MLQKCKILPFMNDPISWSMSSSCTFSLSSNENENLFLVSKNEETQKEAHHKISLSITKRRERSFSIFDSFDTPLLLICSLLFMLRRSFPSRLMRGKGTTWGHLPWNRVIHKRQNLTCLQHFIDFRRATSVGVTWIKIEVYYFYV